MHADRDCSRQQSSIAIPYVVRCAMGYHSNSWTCCTVCMHLCCVSQLSYWRSAL